MAVVYAPNSVGKTSFAKNLRDGHKGNKDIYYKCSPDKNFIVIEDQNSRDIIHGSAGEFFIGHDIALADKLFSEIDSMYTAICDDYSRFLKGVKITSKDSWLIDSLGKINDKFALFTNSISNSRDKGKKDKYETIYSILSDSQFHVEEEAQDIDSQKYDFFVNHGTGVISELLGLFNRVGSEVLVPVPEIRKYEADEAAVSVLKRFPTETTCVVCDTKNIDSHLLLEKKKRSRDEIHSKLDDNTKKLLDDIVSQITDDPFKIKEQVYEFLNTGDSDCLLDLKNELEKYAIEFTKKVINWFISNNSNRKSQKIEPFGSLRYIELYEKYNELVANEPELEDDEQLFLKEVISKSMGKEFKLEWKDGPHGKALKLSLDNWELLNQSRSGLHLSSGEQNFISLVFELLRARQTKTV